MKNLTFQNLNFSSIILGVCVYILVINSSCNKSPNNSNNFITVNPPANNYYSTVFCKINDSDWCDCSVGGGPLGWKSSGIIASYYNTKSGKPLVIEAMNTCESNFKDIYLYIYPFSGIGKYYFTKNGSGSYASYGCNLEGAHTKSFKTDFDYNGIIEITEFDTLKKVVSGSFYFDVLYIDSNQVANITKGTLVKVSYN